MNSSISNEKTFIEKYSTVLFIIIAYFITWIVTFPLSFYYNGLNLIIREIWHSIGSIGPAISSIIIIFLIKGRQGLLELKKRSLNYSGIKLLLFSLSPLFILLIVLLIESALGVFNISQFIQDNNIENIGFFLIFLLPSFSYGCVEEIGWRGFLLPKLQKRYNALQATIFLTIIWWLWHIPMFFYRFDLFFALFLMPLLMLNGSIVFTFLFNQSNGSVLMTIILHICYNTVTSHEISISAIIIVSTLFIFMDIRVIKIFGITSLSRKEAITFSN